ncbi:MAG: CPBP family intramembrane metalloprotease [Abitibacteriaceae bacterium]|nr:CPBP family intramembrane metalloprotease [Abditibacteriaceae bacterium]
MSTGSIPIVETLRRTPPANGGDRVAAIVEVVLAFALVHVTYRALKHFTIIGAWEGKAGTNFIAGIVIVMFVTTILILGRRDLTTYGLSAKEWPYRLNVGLICSIVLLTIEAIGLMLTRIHIDFSKPPDPHAHVSLGRAFALAIIELPAYAIILAMLSARRRIFECLSPVMTAPMIFALLSLFPLVAAYFHQPSMWLVVLWLFFGAGFGEEIFYRGYIQSRVDQAFGFPFRLWGFEFGMGLLVSSLLFGFVHALNTVDYFHGQFAFGWWHGIQSFFVGLFYGLIRAKTGSVLPGAIMHGLSDAFARIPNLLP